MAFLELNGWTVPILNEQASEKVTEIGSTNRAFDGSILKSRIATKRSWEFTARRLPKCDADALIGTVLGKGDVFPYDTGFFSAKGVGADGGSTGTILAPADGSLATDVKFGAAAINVCEATTNISDVVDTDSTSGSWTAIDGATLTDETSAFYVGTGSLSIEASAAVNAARGGASVVVDGAGVATTTTHSLCCYVKAFAAADVGKDVQVRMVDDSTGVSNIITVTLSGIDVWDRVQDVNMTSGGAATAITMFAEEGTIDSGVKFYIDAIQLETGKDNSTAFVSTSRAFQAVTYTDYMPFQVGTASATVSLWTPGPGLTGNEGLSSRAFVLRQKTPSEDRMEFNRTPGGDIRFVLLGANGLEWGTAVENGVWDATPGLPAYKLITGVIFLETPPAGRSLIELYVDGVLVDTVNPSLDNKPVLSEINELRVGGLGGAGLHWNAPIDDVLIVPYAMPPSQIAGMFSSGKAFGEAPELTASGDFICENKVTVVGSTKNFNYRQSADETSGTWLNNQQEVSFRLDEV